LKIESLKFEFCYKTVVSDSIRAKFLIGQYDLENKITIQKFSGDYSLPENWSIGAIVGNSGSGKTSIANKCFGKVEPLKWGSKTLIDDFPTNKTTEEITNILGHVGFNCVPYWLKPFSVLSNGEKARVEMARFICERELIVCDEFTSMVDRDVAKSMCNSIGKILRKMNKKFVGVTCHSDIIPWLKPDWVYDTDKKVFFAREN